MHFFVLSFCTVTFLLLFLSKVLTCYNSNVITQVNKHQILHFLTLSFCLMVAKRYWRVISEMDFFSHHIVNDDLMNVTFCFFSRKTFVDYTRGFHLLVFTVGLSPVICLDWKKAKRNYNESK